MVLYFVFRREVEVPGVPQLSFQDALSSADVNGIIICTEPETHEDYIRCVTSSIVR